MSETAWELGMTKVADGVYAYITEGYTMMSNAALVVGDKYALVFDSLTSAKYGRKFYEACKQVTDKPLRFLVYSHDHGDHTLGASEFLEAIQIAHVSSKKFFAEQAAKGYDRWEPQLFSWVDFEGSRVCYPDIFIDSDTTINLGGREVNIIVTQRTHTVTASMYAIVPDVNVVCCGDLLFNEVCPNGFMQGFFAWSDLLKEMAGLDATYIPGHGPVCGKEGILACRDFIKKVIEGYMKMCAGKTLDQAVDEIDWSKYAKSWVEPGRCYSDIDRLYAMMTNGEPTLPLDPKVEAPLNEKIKRKYKII